MKGNFILEEREKSEINKGLLKANAAAILYPYSRSLISLLSSQVEDKIILPTVNFYKFIEKIPEDSIFQSPDEFIDFD